VATTPYCGGTEQPAAGMGDWCQTPIGGCQIGTQAALDRACQCPSPAGMVNGWVTRQYAAGGPFMAFTKLPEATRIIAQARTGAREIGR